MTSTEDRITQLIDEHLDLGRSPDFDAPLGDAGVSSVDAVAFFKELNKTFNLDMKAEDCLQFRTLREVVTFVDARSG